MTLLPSPVALLKNQSHHAMSSSKHVVLWSSKQTSTINTHLVQLFTTGFQSYFVKYSLLLLFPHRRFYGVLYALIVHPLRGEVNRTSQSSSQPIGYNKRTVWNICFVYCSQFQINLAPISYITNSSLNRQLLVFGPDPRGGTKANSSRVLSINNKMLSVGF